MKIKKLKIALIISFLTLLGNLFIWPNSILKTIFFCLFLFFSIILLGKFIQSKINFENFYWLAGLLISSFFISIGGLTYYIYQINSFTIAIFLLIFTCIILYLTKSISSVEISCPIWPKFDFIDIFLIVSYFFCTGFLIFTLLKNQTSELIKTPWQVLDNDFFVFYFCATFILILAAINHLNKKIVHTFISIHFFLSFIVATIIYKLGYGFDPFIHQAAEKFINEHGVILPKNLFYLGQYSLVIILTKLTSINLIFIDRFLVNIFAAIFLPLSIFHGIKNITFNFYKNTKKFFTEKLFIISPILFLLIPFSPFIFTTPQNLAYVFLLITLFLSLSTQNNQLPIWQIYFFAFTTLIIHPLAGLLIVTWTFFISCWEKKKRFLTVIIGIIGSLIVPLSFWLNSKISRYQTVFKIQSVKLLDYFKTKYLDYSIRDFIYFFDNYFELLIIITAVIAIIQFTIKKTYQYLPLAIFYIITLINYIIVKKYVVFSELIDYEKFDYANRILEISLYFLIPLTIFVSANFIITVVKNTYWPVKIFFIILISLLVCISFYLSYPRNDQYAANSGFNVSQADFNTVKLIENQASGSSYIVLAPQNTSLAALTLYGFSREYNNIYFYSIPTGGKLYQYYRQIIEKDNFNPSMINEIFNLVSVDKIYIVINKYWKNADSIIAKMRKIAKNEYLLNEEQTIIFEF